LRTRRLVLATLAAGLLLAIAGALWLWRELHTVATQPGAATAEQEFEVPQGASLRAVLRTLEQKQLVSSARRLEWYLRYVDPKVLAGSGIQAGRYRILPGHTPLQVLQQLVEGKVVTEQVTIVEGWSYAQMRAQLAKLPDLQQTLAGKSDAELMEALGAPGVFPEGRFAPDTYRYAPGVTTDLQLLRQAFDAQQKNLMEAWESRAPDLPLASPEEALALASIVEKETGLSSERGRVAGVYINRLRTGMRLQSDPTVIYGIRAHYDGNIRKRDLTTDTPYNTYTRPGLPPTPIALPGRDAIVATLNPEKTDALFFVAIGDGTGEHNRAVQRYLERLRAKPFADPAEAQTETAEAATKAEVPAAVGAPVSEP
jgi:UPF0755 protein